VICFILQHKEMQSMFDDQDSSLKLMAFRL